MGYFDKDKPPVLPLSEGTSSRSSAKKTALEIEKNGLDSPRPIAGPRTASTKAIPPMSRNTSNTKKPEEIVQRGNTIKQAKNRKELGRTATSKSGKGPGRPGLERQTTLQTRYV